MGRQGHGMKTPVALKKVNLLLQARDSSSFVLCFVEEEEGIRKTPLRTTWNVV